MLSRSLIEYCSQWPITFATGIRLEWNCLPSHGTADYWNGRINPILASLIEELPASGEWSRENRISRCGFFCGPWTSSTKLKIREAQPSHRRNDSGTSLRGANSNAPPRNASILMTATPTQSIVMLPPYMRRNKEIFRWIAPSTYTERPAASLLVEGHLRP